MKRETAYDNVRFSTDVLREAYRVFMAQVDPGGTAPLSSASRAEVGNRAFDLGLCRGGFSKSTEEGSGCAPPRGTSDRPPGKDARDCSARVPKRLHVR